MSATVSKATTFSQNKIHPKKFALWVACGSMLMMFAGLSSAYMVREAAGNWLEFQLPGIFSLSTVIILLSSVALHISFSQFKSGKEKAYKGFLLIALFLGLAFIVTQYQGWQAMVEMGVPLKTNPSGDFIYVISGIHAAHVLGGVGTLIVAIIHAFALPFQVTSGRKLRFELTLTFWHFVDFLWLYLFTFLSM